MFNFSRDKTEPVKDNSIKGAYKNGKGTKVNVARALGILSVGIGALELISPGKVRRATGLRAKNSLIRTYGARGLVTGIGLVAAPQLSVWRWGRLAGDLLDLSLISRKAGRSKRLYRKGALASAAVGALAVADLICATSAKCSSASSSSKGDVRLQHSLTVNRSAAELYDIWRDLSNLPSIMSHLESVEVLDQKRSLWRVHGPGGKAIEWEATITEEDPGRLIAWESTSNSMVMNRGRVTFEPGHSEDETIINVNITYRPPGGRGGQFLAWLFGESPQHQITEDLRIFKQVIETGEIASTRGQTSGRRRMWRGKLSSQPAHPGKDPSSLVDRLGGQFFH